MNSKKVDVSAVLFSFNEEDILEKCLKALYFCNEIIVIDLYSIDNTFNIARKFASKVYQKEKEPFVEFYLQLLWLRFLI